MGDGYWNRQQPPSAPSPGMLKRPRPDYDLPPSGLSLTHSMQSYLPTDDQGGHRAVKDSKTIGSAYDRYLQSTQLSSLTSGEASKFGGVGFNRTLDGGMSQLPTMMGHPGPGPQRLDLPSNGLDGNFGGSLSIDPMSRPSMGREAAAPLPPDASSTLYVEGLPSNCTRREVAHIFRPFVGYKEVRLASKESKHRNGDPLILCFVDFINPACATTAMNALQGYKVDEHEPNSAYLRLQYSRFPGPRSGPGPRGRR
ncbi:RNA-binding protein 2-like [Punica granatum]|uniref:RNA-binding protein 2-like n=1 Tax=Punica granatum TaxID=22663 RepID=A0A6P8BT62_PUNGR|nr:RNA-binding protein 2-like [Punica granatum]